MLDTGRGSVKQIIDLINERNPFAKTAGLNKDNPITYFHEYLCELCILDAFSSIPIYIFIGIY